MIIKTVNITPYISASGKGGGEPMEAARGGQIVKDYEKSCIYIFTPSGGRKQKLLGHHRTPRNN